MKTYRAELIWGILFSLAIVLWIVLERLIGLHDEHIEHHAVFSTLFALPAIAIYVWAFLWRRARPVAVGWWPAFLFGLRITLVVALLSPLVQWLMHALISPDFLSNAADYAVVAGELSREQAERYFRLSSYMIQGAVGALIMGSITSAVVAVFARRRAGAPQNVN